LGVKLADWAAGTAYQETKQAEHEPQSGTENERGGRRHTMPLTVTDCIVTNNSITITFSDPVLDKNQVSSTPIDWSYAIAPPPPTDKTKLKQYHSPLNSANYTIFDSGSADFQPQPKTVATFDQPVGSSNVVVVSDRTITINFPPAGTRKKEFQDGDWVNIVIRHVRGLSESGDHVPELEGDFVMIARQVPGSGRTARVIRDAEDAISYPILTEEVGYPPSIGSRRGAGGFSSGGGAGQGLGQVASKAISDALGWKPNATDPKGFVGALTQSFSLSEVEGHVESKWNPRAYTVQSDLAGGITGAQASLYTRAKDAQDNCLRLLDGLYPLDPTADTEYVKALREMAKSQICEIVKQFGVVPPSILRINTYFKILLGVHRLRFDNEPRVESDPDKIEGTLGRLRDTYGVYFQKRFRDNRFSNSVEDEENITNFRVISDYMTSLLQSWLSNGRYFILSTTRAPAFLGTQLVLISRQLNVIAETVNEVRFALDSVFIGPNERQTLLLEFPDTFDLPAMYLEDVLTEIEGSVTEEMPRLIKDGGRIAVNNNLLPVLQTLMNLVEGSRVPKNLDALPDGFSTARVRHALDDLNDQLTQLFKLGQQIGMQIPDSLELEVEVLREKEHKP
jgi:hypothetical protein